MQVIYLIKKIIAKKLKIIFLEIVIVRMQNVHLLSQFSFHYYGVGLNPGMRTDPFTLWLKPDSENHFDKILEPKQGVL